MGRYLGDRYQGKLLASDAAGKIPYYSGLRTIDMLGLNDRHIARIQPTFFEVGHNKYDPDYVLSLCPDLIVTWIKDLDVNLRRGLTRDKYDGKYRWAYLVNTDKESAENNIIDVRGYSVTELHELLIQEYIFIVLEKVQCPAGS